LRDEDEGGRQVTAPSSAVLGKLLPAIGKVHTIQTLQITLTNGLFFSSTKLSVLFMLVLNVEKIGYRKWPDG
jgi:hypothetical protein